MSFVNVTIDGSRFFGFVYAGMLATGAFVRETFNLLGGCCCIVVVVVLEVLKVLEILEGLKVFENFESLESVELLGFLTGFEN